MTAAELLRAVRRALRENPAASADEQAAMIARKIVALAKTARELLPTPAAIDAHLARERRNGRIRALAREGVGLGALSLRFGISRRQVRRIARGT